VVCVRLLRRDERHHIAELVLLQRGSHASSLMSPGP
jgi:hypothetical protein